MGLEERGYPNLGYVSPDTQNGSSVWVLCWRLYVLCWRPILGLGFQMGLLLEIALLRLAEDAGDVWCGLGLVQLRKIFGFVYCSTFVCL
jgi:hypothetical protein